jgi:hypothetical protein
MENVIALHQSAVGAGVDPAQALDGKAHSRQLATRPAAAGTAYAGKYEQGAARQIQQPTVGIEIGQFQAGHYTVHE